VQTKDEVLKEALKAREEEVLHYQINIDNYRLAIKKSAGDPELEEFVARLRELLSSSLLEQKKAKIMLEVIREQVEQ
jgi:hypothetical protein